MRIYHLTQFLIHQKNMAKGLHEGSATDRLAGCCEKHDGDNDDDGDVRSPSMIYLNRMEDHAVYYQE